MHRLILDVVTRRGRTATDPGGVATAGTTKAPDRVSAVQGPSGRCLNECPEGDLNPHAPKGTSTSS